MSDKNEPLKPKYKHIPTELTEDRVCKSVCVNSASQFFNVPNFILA